MFITEGTFVVCQLYLPNNRYPVMDYLESLARSDPSCFASVFKKMEKLSDPNYHSPPAVKWLKGENLRGIRELRVIAGNTRHYARLPFIVSGGRVVLLFGETKKGGKPPHGFIGRAIEYRDYVLTNQENSYEQIDFNVFED
jgi:hypothetical protein